ncbi:hypothetical protein D9758_007852 [Tetrapyrgos nigripes]|uniref:SUZ domain-containing protein n=1 Tax=Tetrapyrgos nigripes TaxID=182062 RepID=A0A8H5FV87_9AGAR|nr:hypothetical protein D9758_007852 [Tetrapyrgos nigripes]
MLPEPSSGPPPSSESSISISSAPSSRVISPAMTTISEFSSPPSILTASSSPASLVMPSTGTHSGSPSPFIDGLALQSQPSSQFNAHYTNGESASSTVPSQSQTPDVDPQIIEALRSKDRLYVLKLGEIMEGLIKEKRRDFIGRADLSPSTSYQRLLVHRCSAYYKLTPESDPVTKTIFVTFSAESRIPGRRIADLVPPEPTTQPAFKIMRRSQQDRRVKPNSHAGSVTGEDADSSDVEPSEAGSMGGRSNATGGSGKKWMTIEEREAAYNAARNRIFMDFEEKEKEKEKDMSASSSSGLTSASASHAGSSVGDTDDASSSLATESEWSGPSFNKKDSRRSNTSSSTRSIRSSNVPFPNGSGNSSRNSRASSPSFTYASLYEPAPSSTTYDGPHHVQHSAPGAYPNPPLMYPYPPPPQSQQPPPNHPYMPPYPYYPPYAFGQPPQPPQNSSDGPPSTPSEVYPPPPPHLLYSNSYMWPPPANPPSVHSAPPVPSQPPNGRMPGPQPHQLPQHPQPYPQYMHPPYPYPMPGYYTSPPGSGPVHSPPNAVGQLFNDSRIPGSGNGNVHGNAQRGNPNQRGMPRNGGNSVNGGGKRNNAPLPRPAWSYGPGVGMGGVPMNGGNSTMNGGGEIIGPRLSSSMRRQSNTSTGSSGNYRPSPNDDVASTASSSTSSSSRRTYTSTASSQQHPLPARPDWAVGLKPDPTLHATNRHHDHSHTNSRNMSPISPPRALSGGSNVSTRRPQDQTQPVYLQSTDFPPLSLSSPEKRTPAVGGAWTNNATRSLLMTPPSQSMPGNALVPQPGLTHPNVVVNNNNNAMPRLDDSFDRSSSKAAELYNPKVVKRPSPFDNRLMNATSDKDQPKGGEGGLSEQMYSMSLAESSHTGSSSLSA